MSFNIPDGYGGSIPVERELSIKEIHSVLIEILDDLDAFCNANNLKYFLAGGTLIGSVREKALIAWDDDADIFMPREDFEAFRKSYTPKDGLVVLDYQQIPWYKRPQIRICDSRTVFDYEVQHGSMPQHGVFVDILPLDSVKSSSSLHDSLLLLMYKVYNYAHVFGDYRPDSGSKVKRLLQGGIGWLMRNTLGRLSHKGFLSRLEKAFAGSDGEYYRNYIGTWGEKEVGPKAWFADWTPVSLYGHQFRAPVGYDGWLSHLYGDYMSPPKGEHVHGHSYLRTGIDEDVMPWDILEAPKDGSSS